MTSHTNQLKSPKRVWEAVKKHGSFVIVLLLFSFIQAVLLIKNPISGMDEIGWDMNAYLVSGYTLLTKGTLTIYGAPSAWIMPGFPAMLAFFMWIFGTGTSFFAALRIFFIILSLSSFFAVYKTALRFCDPLRAGMCCAFLLHVEFIQFSSYFVHMEAPFIFLFVWIIYFTVMLAGTRKPVWFWLMFAAWFASVLIRPMIIFYPLLVIVLLIYKKYDRKLLLKQVSGAFLLSLIFFVPWTFRNYKWFDAFIPLNYGSYNPIWEGSLWDNQGYNIPPEDEQATQAVLNSFPEDWRESINNYTHYRYFLEDAADPEFEYPNAEEMKSRALSQYRYNFFLGKAAEARKKQWLADDPANYFYNYLYYKPFVLGQFAMVSRTNIGVSGAESPLIRIPLSLYFIASGFSMPFDFLFTAMGVYYVFNRKKNRALSLVIILTYIILIAAMAFSFTTPRYVVPLRPIRCILMAWGLSMMRRPKWLEKEVFFHAYLYRLSEL